MCRDLGIKARVCSISFFFNDTATTEIYTLSLHDALPICFVSNVKAGGTTDVKKPQKKRSKKSSQAISCARNRSEEHTSELQSRQYLVCRLLLEKKNIR